MKEIKKKTLEVMKKIGSMYILYNNLSNLDCFNNINNAIY